MAAATPDQDANSSPPPDPVRKKLNDALRKDEPDLVAFRCKQCLQHIAFNSEFLDDLYPSSFSELLFRRRIKGVTPGPNYELITRPVGVIPVWLDMVPLICSKCQADLGWQIMRVHGAKHKRIKRKRYILLRSNLEVVFVNGL